MDEGREYGFRRAGLGDLPMLRRWIAAPDVARWWDGGDPFDAADLADGRVREWIVSRGEVPFAYLQDYDVHGWPGHHFGYLPAGSRGIDQFIGLPGMIGGGHGRRFIGRHMRGLFAAGAPVIATDPHPENTRAIACYRRCGFRPAGPPRQTEWGLVLPMEARPGAGQRNAAPPGERGAGGRAGAGPG